MDKAKKDQIVSIIDQTNDMTIATIREDGFPQATTVSYINDGLTIYFATSPDSQKSRNLARNNKVSITIDPPYKSWEDIVGLSLGGHAEPVTDQEEIEKVSELMFAKFPQVADYMAPNDVAPEDIAFFRIRPVAISLLDYRQGFGHTELFEL